jgi:hypothetical protein
MIQVNERLLALNLNILEYCLNKVCNLVYHIKL